MTGHFVCPSRCDGSKRSFEDMNMINEWPYIEHNLIDTFRFCPWCGGKMVKEYELREEKKAAG